MPGLDRGPTPLSNRRPPSSTRRGPLIPGLLDPRWYRTRSRGRSGSSASDRRVSNPTRRWRARTLFTSSSPVVSRQSSLLDDPHAYLHGSLAADSTVDEFFGDQQRRRQCRCCRQTHDQHLLRGLGRPPNVMATAVHATATE